VSETLRVGVIGSGVIAATHLPYIRRAGGLVVGIADVSMVRANELADRHAVKNIYRTATDLIESERPDVVHVLTPPHTHAEVAIAALERGVHALVEKPMANTTAEVQAMISAAQRGSALLTVDHNRLFDPVMREARRLVDAGVLGDIVAVESFQAGNASDRPWLEKLPGGGIGDLVPHPLYLQLAFLGRAHDLRVAASSGPDGRLDELRVLMRGEHGASGVLTISTRAVPHLNTLKLYGTRMTIEVNLNNMTLVKRRDYAAPKVIAKSLPNLDEALMLTRQTIVNAVQFLRGKVRYYPGMGVLIERFYAAIRSGGQAPVSTAEGAEVVRVTEGIWRAVRAEREAARAPAAGQRMEARV
jgi:predicted dehydrogenase